MSIKPGITSAGFRTAVRDYTEPTVVEELAANSYDADASTVLVLLDSQKDELHVLDDGMGFSQDPFDQMAVLGAGDKQNVSFSRGKRPYLGSYGYGLKSTLNIASKLRVRSISEDGEFATTIDWTRLDDALKPAFPGFPSTKKRKMKKQATGTHIVLSLKSPISRDHLEQVGNVLANLPGDSGNFKCYHGMWRDAAHDAQTARKDYSKIRTISKRLHKKHLLHSPSSSANADLDECEKIVLKDKIDKSVLGTFFFSGMEGGKVVSLKPGLRGIYIRIHGRLLKQSFTDRKYTYPISKWVKFESGLRVELSIDWLRDQISLSREGIRFSNTKLEAEFRNVLTRLVSRFIQPQLKKLERRKATEADRKHKQRISLANKRISDKKPVMVPGLKAGFPFKPESDGELALLLSQKDVLKKINSYFRLIDYNDQAPFDCLIYDQTNRTFLNVELEPNLLAFLGHRGTKDIQLIITWAKGNWRIGATKKGHGGHYRLTPEDPKKRGRYKLLEFPSPRSKKPRRHYPVVVLEELF